MLVLVAIAILNRQSFLYIIYFEFNKLFEAEITFHWEFIFIFFFKKKISFFINFICDVNPSIVGLIEN